MNLPLIRRCLAVATAFGLAALIAILPSSQLRSQNAGQVLLTMTGSELIQLDVANTAAIAYTSTSSLRDGLFYVYSVPTTGFSTALTPQQGLLTLNPAGTLAAGTVTLPSTLVDGKAVRIFSTQTITALTINTANGATFAPAVPTTIAANTQLAFVYDKALNQWHRFQ